MSKLTQISMSRRNGIGEIVAGRRAISADTDLWLCRFSGLSRGYRLRAQAAHDTEVAERELAPVDTPIWVSCPKKSSKVPTTITDGVIREIWSGLKLVARRELR